MLFHGILIVSTDIQFGTTFFDSSDIADTAFTVGGFELNTTYYWKVNAYNSNGESGYSETRSFNTSVTDINEEKNIPHEFSLAQNYPNPFNPSTTIQFALPNESFTKLEIFNAIGEKVSTLVEEILSAGTYKYEWNAENLPSGIYFYRLIASDFVQTKKLLLMK